MPNWCLNIVTATFPTPEEAEEFAAKNRTTDSHGRESEFTPNRYIPMPPELRDNSSPTYELKKAEFLERYGAGDWYDWAVKNWGTKWDTRPEQTQVSVDGEVVTIRFDTAWSPYASTVYEAMSREFPNAVIAMSYDEPGMDFGGYDIYKGGRAVRSSWGGSRLDDWNDLATFEADQWVTS